MGGALRLEILLVFLLIILIILHLLKKDRLPVKYSLVWLFSAMIMVLVACFPKILSFTAKVLGFNLASNMLLSVFLGILIFITISLTIIVSGQKKRITLLIQEVSLLKERIDGNEK